jgi:O-antigen ligase
VQSISENPVLGVGSGNWKIESIRYDKMFMYNYTVPYHVHNDFLEIGAELGLIGLGLYLFVIFYVLVSIYKKLLSRSFHISPINSETIIIFAGAVYCVDAALNFPHARPVMQIPFVLIIAITYSLVRIKNKVKDV